MRDIVVICAFSCDPNIPSEPTVGWTYLRTWMKIATSSEAIEVMAIMSQSSKLATDAQISLVDPTAANYSTVAIELPRVARILEKSQHLTRFEYLLWCFLTRRYLRKQSKSRNIILARHVTFASELLPTPISEMTGKAFTVWGPVGSLGEANAFLVIPRHSRWRSQFILQRVRDAISRLQSRRIARGVDLVLTTSQTLADDLSKQGVETLTFPNTRLDSDLLDIINKGQEPSGCAPVHQGDGASLNLLCVGNLVYLKRFELAIAALLDPRLSSATLSIIGKPAQGRENYLLQIADSLGVRDRVQFLGRIPRQEVIQAMLESDVLVHPSTREGGSAVVGEATAVGLPVVCFARTGAAVVLDFAGGNGIKVEANNYSTETLIADAIVKASALPRRPAQLWHRDRYLEMEVGLLTAARSMAKMRRDFASE